jgi:hypothetical protein
MTSIPTIDPATFQSIVSGITGHDSSGGLVAAVGSLVAGNIATGIISKAVSGGALSVIDPLGLATHLASGGATPAAIATVPGLGTVVPAATSAAAPAAKTTVPLTVFLSLPAAQQKALVDAGVILA